MSAPLTLRSIRPQDFPNGIQDASSVQRLGNLIAPMLAQLKTLSTNGVSISQNLDAQMLSFSVTTPGTDWIQVSGGIGFTNGWVPYGGVQSTPRYRRMPTGDTEVEGYVKSGTVGTSPFTLPVAIRPVTQKTFITLGSTGPTAQVAVRSEVAPAGTIVSSSLGAVLTNDFWGLDGIRFTTATNSPGILSCFPFRVKVNDTRRPKAVLLLSCADHNSANPPDTPNTGSTPSILVPGLQWSFVNATDGKQYISIDGMPGLALGRTYDLSCLVLY